MVLYADYAGVDDLKRFLRIPGVYEGTLNQTEDLYEDLLLTSAITAASRAIDNAANRSFGTVDSPVAFTYTPEWDRNLNRYVVYMDDVMTTSGYQIFTRQFRTSAFNQEITDYDLYPRNAAYYGKPWTYVVLNQSCGDAVEITAKWGWTAVPDTIKSATLIQASRFYKRKDAPFGIAGSPTEGSELRLLARVDPDVQVMVTPYKKYYGGV